MKSTPPEKMVAKKIVDKASTTAHANTCDTRNKRRVKRVEREQFKASLKEPDTYAAFVQRI